MKVDKKRRSPADLSIVLLNRGGHFYRNDLLLELEKLGLPEVISIEGPGSSYDVEDYAGRFPRIKFLLLHSMASIGEQVNIGIEEAYSKLVLVIWNDINIHSASVSSRTIERIINNDVLCTVPMLQNQKLETLPTIQVPAFHKKRLKVVSLQPETDQMVSLYPFDYVGMYNKERFTNTGGYDHNLINPYWQKLDFGFRSFMWGESIQCNTSFRLTYRNSPPVEDTTPDENYKIFFLKNLAVRFKGDMGILPVAAFLRYFIKTDSSFIEAIREFKEARRWVALNKYRFKQDARSVTDLWEVPGTW
jgi:hypothetical protein